MRILFMGTPEFAVPSLKRLAADKHDICCVVTGVDKPAGRGMKFRPSPVKICAGELGLGLYQPESLKNQDAARYIASMEPEAIVVVAYGKLLPESILTLPPRGCINIHGSLLPAYRGAAPVQWAVLNGDPVTGVTSMYMAKKLDAGDVIDSIQTPVGPDENAEELYSRLALLGAELLSRTLKSVQEGTVRPVKQDESRVTYAPPLTRGMAELDFREPAQSVYNKIRGLRPWPVARARINGKTFKIFGARILDPDGAEPGTILGSDGEGIYIACAGGTILITELQAEGSKRMSAADYLRGHEL
jgi:methionyl-tRNA formyltransferase